MNVRNVLPRDAIPSIDDPVFGEEYFGDPEDELVVVDGDPPRAYPIRILSYHEIVNDTVGGAPLAVTWCPICWSAVVYDRTVDDLTLTFGVSGKLADDALVMYDRETDSEWKQPTGTAFAGELAGTQLDVRPFRIDTWRRFATRSPGGIVLQPVRGTASGGESPRSVYDMTPYEQYVQRDAFGLYGMRGQGNPRTWERTDLDAKTVVLGVELDGEAVGYPVPTVESEGGIVTDVVGGIDIVVLSLDERIQAFENPGFTFERRGETVHADGTTWDPVTGESADGRRLTSVPGRRLFAFAWRDAYGEGRFFEPSA